MCAHALSYSEQCLPLVFSSQIDVNSKLKAHQFKPMPEIHYKLFGITVSHSTSTKITTHYFTGKLDKDSGFSDSIQFSNALTSPGCSAILFNSDTNFLELTQTPKIKGSVLQHCLHFKQEPLVGCPGCPHFCLASYKLTSYYDLTSASITDKTNKTQDSTVFTITVLLCRIQSSNR